uniref:SAM-dependent methyltransferase n=1 Tax=Sciscionella sediminilitoris TaxID=1445613 RepID=UPI0018D07619
AVENRHFLRRAVRFAAEQGIRQFLDLGAGIPNVNPTHEVARAVNPDTKVVYVDSEPVAVIEARRKLEGDQNPLSCRRNSRTWTRFCSSRPPCWTSASRSR